MGDLERDVNEMKAQNLRLVEENKSLTNRKATLEKFLVLKEEQINVLQEGANVRCPTCRICSHLASAVSASSSVFSACLW